MKIIFIFVTLFASSAAFALEASTLYFSCNVKETVEGKKLDVNVKFAVQGYDADKRTGNLLPYPNAAEDDFGEPFTILVTPVSNENDYLTRMSNLNAQGGDLTVNPDGSVFLWGDGDGYQFTDLVVWDVDYALNNAEEGETLFKLEGYVRDYGSAYMGKIDFKQFIKCDMSTEVL
jgi:hypothetical protein